MSDYRFTLKFAAMQKIEVLSDGTPFAVTVDKQLIYHGMFKPNFSSSFCDQSIRMAVDWLAGNSIVLSLGYTSPSSVTTVNDQRNNSKLIATLQHQGKLHLQISWSSNCQSTFLPVLTSINCRVRT